eukprot:Blabericola_migrator_1__4770@NODE_250_length_10882_cov_193_783819_g211_i0_p2_GENE_NODE_250_length_10882_cov_193_783819_g211_i0NODE_250_length_10882_cov_193_783819_g211_i0_p2_ORF_typecomplete_len544_score96_84_NODE_250_length_10882_cov_193_783819_g211_i05072138
MSDAHRNKRGADTCTSPKQYLHNFMLHLLFLLHFLLRLAQTEELTVTTSLTQTHFRGSTYLLQKVAHTTTDLTTATSISTDDPNQHPPRFYPGHEAEMRTRPFEERAKDIPYNSWQTPAWRAMTYVTPDPDIRVVYDSRDPATADRGRRNFLREMVATYNVTDEVEAAASEWAATFHRVSQAFHEDIENTHRLLLQPDQQNISSKITVGVPAVPRALRKTFVFFEGLKSVVTLPQQVVMVMSGPSKLSEYVDVKGFFIALPRIVRDLPITKMPFKIVVQMDPKYKQWGNRWLAANMTDADAEYIAFWDGDDFPAPQRWTWFDWVLETRPEIDLLLSGKYMIPFTTFQNATDEIVKNMLDVARPPVNETWAELIDLLDTHFNATDIYTEPLKLMNSTYVSEFKVGSILRIPLATGYWYHFPQMYEATYEALNRSHDYTAEQVALMQKELDWLDECKSSDTLGPLWYDINVADGWSTMRRPLLNMINPPTQLMLGEDSTYNWMLGATGLNYMHIVYPFLSWAPGTYFRWDKTHHWEENWRTPAPH